MTEIRKGLLYTGNEEIAKHAVHNQKDHGNRWVDKARTLSVKDPVSGETFFRSTRNNYTHISVKGKSATWHHSKELARKAGGRVLPVVLPEAPKSKPTGKTPPRLTSPTKGITYYHSLGVQWRPTPGRTRRTRLRDAMRSEKLIDGRDENGKYVSIADDQIIYTFDEREKTS